MGTGERPGGMIDVGPIPPLRAVTMGAASLSHLRRELIAVRVVMTVGTGLFSYGETQPWATFAVALATRHGLVAAHQREVGRVVHVGAECGWVEAMRVVALSTLPAITFRKLTSMHIAMTVGALFELQLSISPIRRKRRSMTSRTIHTHVLAVKRKRSALMGAQGNALGHSKPTYVAMTVLTPTAKGCLVDAPMTGHATRATGGGAHITSIMALAALDAAMTSAKTDTRMHRANALHA